MDIPKSFVFPLAVSAGFSILNIMFYSITARYYKDNEIEEPFKTEKLSIGKFLLFRLFSLDTLILFVFLIAYYIILNYPLKPGAWIWSAVIITIVCSIKFLNSPIVKRYVQWAELRMYLSYVVIAIPISCFVIGKTLSLRVYNNDKIVYYQESTQYPPGNISKLKLIGFAGDKMILSTLNNQQIVVVNSGTKDQFVLVMEEKQKQE